ncbi:MAG TPA: hypothetical protein VM733_13745 [Thermoanaerobaculia bacterium]|nr:hypothetical protein [Thermoanaerobaculia bacterium]
MDPEFQRPLIIVLVAGILVAGIATTALALAFRAAKGGRPMHPGILGGLIVFVFACCAALFWLAYQ